MTTRFEIDLVDEVAMLAFGERFAKLSEHPLVVFLHGQLGAGKTTLVRGILRGLGFTGHVKSPTYTLVETYDVERGSVFHFDFYRLHDPDELELMGIQDYFAPNAMCLIEWPDMGRGYLPLPDIDCYIELQTTGRHVKCVSNTPHGHDILQRLQNEK